MKDNRPSRTALRVAMRRAAHQLLDDPRIFDDPLALRILGEEKAAALGSPETRISPGLRLHLALRSRYAEDELEAAVRRGVRQYVILGAGLDTFAYRSPHPHNALRVFEVDHPATQDWKRACLEAAGMAIPSTLTFVPVDFETQNLEDGLLSAGFDAGQGAFFSWLGVTQYLTNSAVMNTLRFVASLPAGSGIVFDYTLSPARLNPLARLIFDRLARRVALAGEPFLSCFDPAELEGRLRGMGFRQVEDLGPGEMNARYLKEHPENSRVGSIARVLCARV
jgi:methyltransferase (TIGR00027 family)